MHEILADLIQSLQQGRSLVICRVVETRGSTPQKPGAAMLVFADGTQIGTLGGGCVEAEVKQRALRVLSSADSAGPDLFTFNLDDNYGWDDGLICGGRMTILADPVHDEGSRNSRLKYFGKLQQLMESGLGCTEAIVLRESTAQIPIGNPYLFDAEGGLASCIGPNEGHESLQVHVQPVQNRPKPYTVQGISYLPHLPRITLFIIGGGHVGLAVAKLAAEVDFNIWVLDDRESYAGKARFPMASRNIVGEIGPTLAQLVDRDISPSFFCLIVTRGHNHDEEALYHLANCKASYVGMIGSKRKIKLIYEDLLARGISRESLEKVYAPLGLNIGSRTVPEIAISIVAELIACRNLGTSIPTARTRVTI